MTVPIHAHPHPASYSAWAFNERGGSLKMVTLQWKDPAAGEVVIKVLACGICATDKTVASGVLPAPLPRIPGHEIVGNVVAVGPGEKLWKVGDRVGVGCHGGHCHNCNRCRLGDFITCVEGGLVGILSDGGYAEYVTARSEAVASLPRDMDPAEAAPLMCAGVTVFNALRRVNVLPGDYVAVHGIGGLGHLALQFARAMGFRPVALSSGSKKEALARSLGAEEYLDGSRVDQTEALRKLGGAKVIMCTANAPELIERLISGLAVDGTLLLLSVDDKQFSISPLSLLRHRFSIRGMPNGTAKDIEDCTAFVRAHGIRCMVETFPLDKTPEAYKHLDSARFRSVVVA
ncbi:GroES-like protein [Daedaleopsis nitida]|nr:GroES-like protein [Daedaleopsis nitida]